MDMNESEIEGSPTRSHLRNRDIIGRVLFTSILPALTLGSIVLVISISGAK